nr:hypothetical protein [Tanacetum cinerariifolium]
MHIAQPSMNMDQDRQMLIVEDNNVGNQNGLSVDLGIANQYGIRNVLTARAEGNGAYDEIKEVNTNCTLKDNFAASINISQTRLSLGYQNPFYLKQAQQKQQSLYNGKVLLEKHDSPIVYDSDETLQLAQESRFEMKQLNKQIKPANSAKTNQLSGVFVSQKAKSHEELYFSNTSKMAIISKSISIPNEEFSNDTSPSVARKFLNEVKTTIVTL